MPEWKDEIAKRLEGLKLEPAREAEIIDELAQHLKDRYQELLAGGASEEEARRVALEDISDADILAREIKRVETSVKRETPAPGALPGKNIAADLWQDLRYGSRQLRRNPGFTAVAVITLALGIAANTTIFSVVSEILLRKPPIRDPDRVVVVSSKNKVRGWYLNSASALDFEAWRKQNHDFKDIAADEGGLTFMLSGGGAPESLVGDAVTPNYFSILGVFPALGRVFLPSEGQAGHDHVVILSNQLWRERYDANPRVIGRSIQVNGEPHTIIGLMPPGTDMLGFAPRLWTPLVFQPKDLVGPSAGNHRSLLAFARLKPGVTVTQAQAEMAAIASRLAKTHPKTDRGWSVSVLTLQEFLIRSDGGVRQVLTVLMAMVGLVLLIACANIAGLLLARASARRHEMTIRSAVGASRLRLIRQMLAESLLIGAAGGAVGLLISVWGIHLLRVGLDFNSDGRLLAAGLHLDRPTLIFTVAISLFTVILFGFVPALRASKTDLAGGLKEGGRTESGSRRRSKLRNVLVVGEIALALILLAGAGVMMREFVNEMTASTGFNASRLITAEIHLNGRNYQKPAQQKSFFELVTQKLKQLPGVKSASATSALPLSGNTDDTTLSIEGQPSLPPSKRPVADFIVAGPGYFRTMQIPLLKGHEFSPSDTAQSPLVAVVSKEFARHFFPKGNTIGQHIKIGPERHAWADIVGIVGNVSDYPGQLSPAAQVYESYLQVPQADMSLVVRSPLAASIVAPMLRRAVWSVDKDQPVGGETGGVLTMKEVAHQNEGGGTAVVSLMGVFAALALILAAVGIYGVVAFSVNQRTHEIGIRMALGAQQSNVLRLVLRQGGLLTLIGCGIGLALALPLPKLFGALFNGMAPQGPLVASLAGALIVVVSLLATYIPARRAAKVDPIAALRYE